MRIGHVLPRIQAIHSHEEDHPITVYDHAHARVKRRGTTAALAAQFLLQFGTGEGKDIGWGDITPMLTREQAELIDAAADRWLSNPANAARPEPENVRAWKDRRSLKAGKDEGPEAR
jgi:hypothetical protein